MKENITLIGICLAFILLLPVIVVGVFCMIIVIFMVLIFDFIDWLKENLIKNEN